MPTTKADLQNTAQSVTSFLTTVGGVIKENQRQSQLNKVLSEFKDANKLYLNEDGSPKSDAEIIPKITEGVMNLYQLGEKDLASSLMESFKQTSVALNKDATNVFNYEQFSPDPRFPKGADGRVIPYDNRKDFSKFEGTNQYAPRDKKFYAPKSFNLGDRVKIYEWDADAQVWNVKDEQFNKPPNVNYNYSQSNVNMSGQEQTATYLDTNGKIRNVVYKDGIPYDAGSGNPIKDMINWQPTTENAPFAKNEEKLTNITNRVLGGLDMSGLKNNTELQMYFNQYKNEIVNWLQGGIMPSFMDSDWIIRNQTTFNDMLKLKTQK